MQPFFRRLKTRLGQTWHQFPPQFWLMVGGMFLSLAGTSMVWPFLALYVSARLQIPLAEVGILITLQALAGAVGTLLAGLLVDRWGRKTGMVLSLVGMAVSYVALTWANSWRAFAAAMALMGLFAPAFRIGGDAMAADMVPPQERDQAYALLRTASNAGLAVGPMMGGWLAAMASYAWAFYGAAASLMLYALILLKWARETRPNSDDPATPSAEEANPLKAYGVLLRDARLLAFLAAALVTWMAGGLIWIYLGVYMRDWYGLGEAKYSVLVTTNAVMVMLLQYRVTSWAKQVLSPRLMMVIGALLYAGATGGVLLAQTFWAFWSLMVIMTVGEMLLVPTASTWVANLAPVHLRGRYLSTMAFMWSLGAGVIAPVGGWLSDRFSPRAPWVAGAILAILGALGFALQQPPPSSAENAAAHTAP